MAACVGGLGGGLSNQRRPTGLISITKHGRYDAYAPEDRLGDAVLGRVDERDKPHEAVAVVGDLVLHLLVLVVGGGGEVVLRLWCWCGRVVSVGGRVVEAFVC